MKSNSINPFYLTAVSRTEPSPGREYRSPVYARLPLAPRNASTVPHLTSLYHFNRTSEYGQRSYPGNCGGNLIKDLLRYFKPVTLLDPMTGSGTCRDVCRDLGVLCWSSDIREGTDACDPSQFPRDTFNFCWLHPPYWRQKLYTDDPRDLSRTPTLDAFLVRYQRLIRNCAGALAARGKLAILMGDYHDREAGFVPLVYHTKRIAFECGLRQHTTDIIRFSHGASSSNKVYRSAFIPGLHDVCMIFEKQS
jgi:hypothetical protein